MTTKAFRKTSLNNSRSSVPSLAARFSSPLEQVRIDQLGKNPKNARTHSKAQIRKIARSIDRFGFLNPLLVDDENRVLAGHGRLEAARLLGLTSAPVLRFSHMSEAEKRAFVLADNKIAEEAGWDRELLTLELGELADLLPEEGLDISLTGFEPAEVDLLLADLGEQKTAPEDLLPALPENPVTRRGDLWLLKDHRLLCGDARNSLDYSRLMNGARVSAVFCDPPFNLKIKSLVGRGRAQHREFAFGSGEMSSAEFVVFLETTLGNAVRFCEDGSIHYVFIDWRHIAELIAVGQKIYGCMLNLVVWNKTNAGQGSFYRSQHELIGVFRAGSESHLNNVQLGRFGRNRANVWTYPGCNSFGRGRTDALSSHPTVKPVALVADALLDCTVKGASVLDQFMGSGTTLLAAEKVGRRAFGIEYEPGYVDVAIRRWEAMTRLEATLEDDGRTFREIAEARLSGAEEPSGHKEEAVAQTATKAKRGRR